MPKLATIEARCHGKLSAIALLPGEGRVAYVKKATFRNAFNGRFPGMDVSKPSIACLSQFVERFLNAKIYPVSSRFMGWTVVVQFVLEWLVWE